MSFSQNITRAHTSQTKPNRAKLCQATQTDCVCGFYSTVICNSCNTYIAINIIDVYSWVVISARNMLLSPHILDWRQWLIATILIYLSVILCALPFLAPSFIPFSCICSHLRSLALIHSRIAISILIVKCVKHIISLSMRLIYFWFEKCLCSRFDWIDEFASERRNISIAKINGPNRRFRNIELNIYLHKSQCNSFEFVIINERRKDSVTKCLGK